MPVCFFAVRSLLLDPAEEAYDAVPERLLRKSLYSFWILKSQKSRDPK